MTIKKRVETSFEEEDFLEGAKDAWFAGVWLLSTFHALSCSLSPHVTLLQVVLQLVI